MTSLVTVTISINLDAMAVGGAAGQPVVSVSSQTVGAIPEVSGFDIPPPDVNVTAPVIPPPPEAPGEPDTAAAAVELPPPPN